MIDSSSFHRLRGIGLAPALVQHWAQRTLRLDGDAGELEAAFADIAKLAPRCRFRDGQHDAEPGCAVRESVSPERLRNYRKLLREARRDTLTALQRKGQLQQWKVRSRAVRERSKRQDE